MMIDSKGSLAASAALSSWDTVSMGIGRREFLKFAAAALGGLIDPLRTAIVHGDYYVNARLGLGFVKPQGWAFEAFRDFTPDAEGWIVQNLPPDVDEEEFLKDQASTLVATICKYSGAVRRFGPSITVHKNQEDYADVRAVGGLEQAIRHAIDAYAVLLKDYEVLEEPSPCEVSRCPCIRVKSRFLFEHRDIEPILIEDESLAIDQGSLVYSIHLYDSPATGDTAPEEFARFLQSLHIA